MNKTVMAEILSEEIKALVTDLFSRDSRTKPAFFVNAEQAEQGRAWLRQVFGRCRRRLQAHLACRSANCTRGSFPAAPWHAVTVPEEVIPAARRFHARRSPG